MKNKNLPKYLKHDIAHYCSELYDDTSKHITQWIEFISYIHKDFDNLPQYNEYNFTSMRNPIISSRWFQHYILYGRLY